MLAQTYPQWELICVDDSSPAPHVKTVLDELASRDHRITVIRCPWNRGVSGATNLGIEAASGDYIGFMDHDDVLEPHALHRFAEAVAQDQPDLIYSDEAITGENIDTILRVDARPAFSYDHYLGHPYFVHLIAARTELVRKVGALDEEMSISQDVDLNLRLDRGVPDDLPRPRSTLSLAHPPGQPGPSEDRPLPGHDAAGARAAFRSNWPVRDLRGRSAFQLSGCQVSARLAGTRGHLDRQPGVLC